MIQGNLVSGPSDLPVSQYMLGCGSPPYSGEEAVKVTYFGVGWYLGSGHPHTLGCSCWR